MKDWKKITRFVQLHQLYDYSLINIILFSVIIRLVGPFHGFFFSVIHGLFLKKKFVIFGRLFSLWETAKHFTIRLSIKRSEQSRAALTQFKQAM